jgi:signal transduction histidine kinase
LLFQSVRELLINSSKHAGTGRAAVKLEEQDDHVRIIVRDDGAGFDLAATTGAAVSTGDLSSKFGLFSIRERMKALGGSFEIQSAPGKGMTATLTLPLHVQPTQPSSLRAASSMPQDRVEMQADILCGQQNFHSKCRKQFLMNSFYLSTARWKRLS